MSKLFWVVLAVLENLWPYAVMVFTGWILFASNWHWGLRVVAGIAFVPEALIVALLLGRLVFHLPPRHP